MVNYLTSASTNLYYNYVVPTGKSVYNASTNLYNKHIYPASQVAYIKCKNAYDTYVHPVGKTFHDATVPQITKVWNGFLKELQGAENERFFKNSHRVGLGIAATVSILTVATLGETGVPIAALIIGLSLMFILKSARGEETVKDEDKVKNGNLKDL